MSLIVDILELLILFCCHPGKPFPYDKARKICMGSYFEEKVEEQMSKKEIIGRNFDGKIMFSEDSLAWLRFVCIMRIIKKLFLEIGVICSIIAGIYALNECRRHDEPKVYYLIPSDSTIVPVRVIPANQP